MLAGFRMGGFKGFTKVSADPFDIHCMVVSVKTPIDMIRASLQRGKLGRRRRCDREDWRCMSMGGGLFLDCAGLVGGGSMT